MEISQRVADQLRTLMQRVYTLEERIRAMSTDRDGNDVHYIVEAPDTGIPAYDSAQKIPGKAVCKIVRRYGADPGSLKPLVAMTIKETVYNLAGSISAGAIAVAHRDVYGDLVIPASGASVIRFRLTEELQQCGAAAANILDDGCDAPGGTPEEITVVDNLAIANITVNAFDDNIAPEGAIGFARLVVNPDPLDPNTQYELINIDWGCCIAPTCLQIPRLHFVKIPEGIPAWALGYDVDGCLIKFPVAVCIPCEPIPAPEPPP
jgi:hypothetical protein